MLSQCLAIGTPEPVTNCHRIHSRAHRFPMLWSLGNWRSLFIQTAVKPSHADPQYRSDQNIFTLALSAKPLPTLGFMYCEATRTVAEIRSSRNWSGVRSVCVAHFLVCSEMLSTVWAVVFSLMLHTPADADIAEAVDSAWSDLDTLTAQAAISCLSIQPLDLLLMSNFNNARGPILGARSGNPNQLRLRHLSRFFGFQPSVISESPSNVEFS